jgi:hypothetical protein
MIVDIPHLGEEDLIEGVALAVDGNHVLLVYEYVPLTNNVNGWLYQKLRAFEAESSGFLTLADWKIPSPIGHAPWIDFDGADYLGAPSMLLLGQETILTYATQQYGIRVRGNWQTHFDPIAPGTTPSFAGTLAASDQRLAYGYLDDLTGALFVAREQGRIAPGDSGWTVSEVVPAGHCNSIPALIDFDERLAVAWSDPTDNHIWVGLANSVF